jgi:hypothetical protein
VGGLELPAEILMGDKGAAMCVLSGDFALWAVNVDGFLW